MHCRMCALCSWSARHSAMWVFRAKLYVPRRSTLAAISHGREAWIPLFWLGLGTRSGTTQRSPTRSGPPGSGRCGKGRSLALPLVPPRGAQRDTACLIPIAPTRSGPWHRLWFHPERPRVARLARYNPGGRGGGGRWHQKETTPCTQPLHATFPCVKTLRKFRGLPPDSV